MTQPKEATLERDEDPITLAEACDKPARRSDRMIGLADFSAQLGVTPGILREWLDLIPFAPPAMAVDGQLLWRVKKIAHLWHGQVYFLRAMGFIKIGISRCFADRIRNIQAGLPVELETLHVMPGWEFSETSLHNKFSRLRARGEWFREADEIAEFIDVIKKVGPVDPIDPWDWAP